MYSIIMVKCNNFCGIIILIMMQTLAFANIIRTASYQKLFVCFLEKDSVNLLGVTILLKETHRY